MKTSNGFSMLETLITMVIVMFGVLGIARVQLMAVTNTDTARYKETAAMAASSLAAKMQANVGFWGGFSGANVTVANGSTITGGPGYYVLNCDSPTVCANADMAYTDLLEFGKQLYGVPNVYGGLPGGKGTIYCPQGVTPLVCSITIQWSEKNVALTNATAGVSGQFATGTQSTSAAGYKTLVSLVP